MPFNNFSIVYIDDILVFPSNVEEHFRHLEIFRKIIFHNGIVISKSKMKICKSKVRFLGHNIR